MLVCVALFELDIEFAQSLKDKRMVVRSLKEKLRSRFEISAAEVGLLDLHLRSRVAVSFTGPDHAAAVAPFEKIQTFVESHTDAVLAGWISEKLEFDETLQL